MSDAVFALMHELARWIVVDAASADALFAIADKAEIMGCSGEAAAIRSIARMHRAKVIELQARLDALSIDYVDH